ncbi:DUF3006 domain-containing protein [Peribacillus asahii]|uniref:DUF3006 domain-containing protein n=1 Tax=Peribacillus asahii TaxID=228899 RepID=A0A398BFG1_9BACI|nr:DUF3006 domain-containing protein [Peribacillus asahii]RID88762.1 DUF3006 domain-containing protein [Peribacillus asahii]
MEKGIIDRFEGDLAVVEFNDTMEDIPKAKLPKEAGIGDVLIFDGDKIIIDTKKKAKLKQEIEDLMDELFDD